MARISGLASEHHPQGPGDSARRKKARKSTHTPADDISQGSKRAVSPSAESSQVKRKRVQIDDHDQLARELEDSVSRAGSQDNVHETIHLAAPRVNRRHSEPLVLPQDEDDSQITPPSTAPLADRPIACGRGRPANRRTRMSMPAQLHHADEEQEDGDNRQLQFAPLKMVLGSRTQRRLRRSHLSQEVNDIEQHEKEDKKLRKAFSKLQAQLRDKDRMISDLEFQLEARRLGNIEMPDDRAQELEQQLEDARNELEDLRQTAPYTGASAEPSIYDGGMDIDDDDDDLMLVDPNEIDGPSQIEPSPLPNGEYAARALELSSQVTVNSLSTITHTQHDVLAEMDPDRVPDKISEKIVARYEGEIDRLIKSLGQSEGALRIISIELQNLNVVPPGASSNVIIETLRRDFEALREELENLVPGRTLGLTNSELLRKIPTILEGALAELHEKVNSADKYYQNEQVLRHQYEHVIDLLSRADDRTTQLEQDVQDLQDANATKQQTIDELEDRVTAMNVELDAQDTELNNKTAEINGLQDEVGDKETSMARLQDALNSYHKDLEVLTATTTRLEEEHRQTIGDMQAAHAGVVADLEDRLVEEMDGRTVAETDAINKKEYIDNLERSVENMEQEFDAIKREMDELRNALATETRLRETVEGERDDKTDLAYDQANKIENLEETLQDLENQLADTRNSLEAERRQREETETALDKANDDISSLNDQIHNAGIQANELRSKLFQVQQEKEQTIAELEADSQEQEAENRALLDEERRNREEAEQEIASLKEAVVQLQTEIAAHEATIERLTVSRNELEQDRDEHVASLDAQLAGLQQKYLALENSTNSTITTLQANITDLTNEVHAQRAEIERITSEADESDRVLRGELADKTQEIANLTQDLDEANTENQRLQNANKSLSERVEEGALEILRMTDAQAEQNIALNNTIRLHEGTIRDLQGTLEARQAHHEQVLAEKEREIEELQVAGDARASAIVELNAQIEDMKETFRLAEEDTRTTIDELTKSQRELQAQNEALADALKKRNALALKAIQDMKVAGIEVRTNGANLRKVAHGKVTKVSEKVKVSKKVGKMKKLNTRQWRDSGFGMDEDEEAENAQDELLDEEVLA
ncbi:hypothetical protein CC80DRAFT_251134 [Byssothecium circinans]|uniref:Uncharacterized protein n=1 Tax=Byssothecium circinans TaxID=147558 RepID=A0A6A5TCE7_9PLEO|nr:hypothetical protein CC80DRAFT_251134 [Byssothecium circinans]